MIMSKIGKILVVDDEVELKSILVESLTNQGYQASGFTSSKAAIKALRELDRQLRRGEVVLHRTCIRRAPIGIRRSPLATYPRKAIIPARLDPKPVER